ncbi:hypothetical protein AAF712_003614 [Marasmius tenuissimus]|uniref:Uncharacterized protein n=1 Tax=Marasmius tenuissimus TaxID=585030 RepID=A0ABR3A6V4_9AGAR
MPTNRKNTLRRASLQRVSHCFFLLSQIFTLVTNAAPVALSLDRLLDESANSTKLPATPEPTLSELPVTVAPVTRTDRFKVLAHKATALLDDVTVSGISIKNVQTFVSLPSIPTPLPVFSSIETITSSVNSEDYTSPSLATTSLASISSFLQQPLSPSTIESSPTSIYSATTVSWPTSIHSASSSLFSSSSPVIIKTGLALQATEADAPYTSIVQPIPTTVQMTVSPSLISNPDQPKPFRLSNHPHLLGFGVLLIVFILFIVISIVITRARRINYCCSRRKRIDYGLDRCIEKDMDRAAAWPQRSSQTSIAPLVCREIWRPQSPSQGPMQDRELARLQNRVIDIVPDFPRSRFSVTSSDLGSIHDPFQIGEAEDDESEADTHIGHDASPLLPPAEFFSLPSTSTIASRHSRRNSAPVFGRHRRVAGLSMASYRLSRAKSLKSKEGHCYQQP